MRIAILYHPDSEHGRPMEDYARDFAYQQGIPTAIELIGLNSRAGADMARLYDVVSYPAVLVIDKDGNLLKFWQGDEVPPLMQELASYARG